MQKTIPSSRDKRDAWKPKPMSLAQLRIAVKWARDFLAALERELEAKNAAARKRRKGGK